MSEPSWLTQARKNRLIVGESQGAVRKEKRALVEPGYERGEGRLTFVVPLYVLSGDNLSGRQSKSRIGRAGHERKAMARVLALGLRGLADMRQWMDAGGAVAVRLERLGGRKMDLSNAIAALKYCQDAVALFLGVEDDDPRLRWEYGQAELGGPYGVRVVMQVTEATA